MARLRTTWNLRALAVATVATLWAATIYAFAAACAAAAPAPTPSPSPTPSAAAAPWPAMVGVLTMNHAPTRLDLGPLGDGVTVGGVVSALGQVQSNASSSDCSAQADLDNAQVFINKSNGEFQYFAQVGTYSLPALGVPYVRAGTATGANYGVLSQWFVKFAPTSDFSIAAGALPTLIGAEDTFSFENMNVERGLLWNQENAVNRGVQANYSVGPVALSASWNDGFFSNRYTWLSGSATWTIDGSKTLAVVAAANTARTSISTTSTPLLQNNERIYNLIYSDAHANWTIEPYLQYTSIPTMPSIGVAHGAATYGGAVYVNYAVPSRSTRAGALNLPVRLEFIGTTGNAANGAPNLLYGPGSSAWSIDLTPTYQIGPFFLRLELSRVGAFNAAPGSIFGPSGTALTQSRALLESGVLF